jgi:hypothetical protein
MVVPRDEAFARDAFTQHLEARGYAGLLWEDGPPNKCPDFFLTLDGQRYAVEVTQVVESLTLGDLIFAERGSLRPSGRLSQSLK